MDKEKLVQEIKMQQRGYLRSVIMGALLVACVIAGIIFIAVRINDNAYTPVLKSDEILLRIKKIDSGKSKLEQYEVSTEREKELKETSLVLLESNRRLLSIMSGAWDGVILMLILGFGGSILSISAVGILFAKRLERLIKEELVL